MGETDIWYADEPCPRCGKRVRVSFDCPGYGDPVMVCAYGCSNATLFECEDAACGWWWREPNHRKASRHAYDGTDRQIEMGPPATWVTSERYRG